MGCHEPNRQAVRPLKRLLVKGEVKVGSVHTAVCHHATTFALAANIQDGEQPIDDHRCASNGKKEPTL
jgi:hypothetical protein